MTDEERAAWRREFARLNPDRPDAKVIERDDYMIVEYSARRGPPRTPVWYPTRMVVPPDGSPQSSAAHAAGSGPSSSSSDG